MKSKNPNIAGALFIVLSLVTLAVGYEIWERQFATIGYFVLIVATPVLVLFISDLKKKKISF